MQLSLDAHPDRRSRDSDLVHAMQDARYYRARAQQTLEVALRISDNQAAKKLRIEAAEFIARAERLESGGSDDEPLPGGMIRDPD
jgi:hypothetical protein